jgi:hypothetical protein
MSAPQHETKQTSLRSLHKMMAATRRYHHERRIRSARGAAPWSYGRKLVTA